MAGPIHDRHHQVEQDQVGPPFTAYDHIDLTAAAARTDEPIPPIERQGCRIVLLGHFGRAGFNLMPAILAPNDQPDLGSGGATQCHRRAGLGFQGGSAD
jgi:hypothetical protein